VILSPAHVQQVTAKSLQRGFQLKPLKPRGRSPSELVMKLHKILSTTKIYFQKTIFSTWLEIYPTWEIGYGPLINVGNHSGKFVFIACLNFGIS